MNMKINFRFFGLPIFILVLGCCSAIGFFLALQHMNAFHPPSIPHNSLYETPIFFLIACLGVTFLALTFAIPVSFHRLKVFKLQQSLLLEKEILSERFLLATKAARIGIMEWKVTENSLWLNELAFAIFQLPHETSEINSAAFIERIIPADRQKIQ